MLIEEESTTNDDSSTMSPKSNVHNLSFGIPLDFVLADWNKNNGSYTWYYYVPHKTIH